MKAHGIINILILSFLMTGWITVKAQRMTEVPGDNFSLEGALELFKKSTSPQEFERMLNDPESRVNNLDLNGDGYIDYIRVVDMNEGRVHVFIMQAVISNLENQDIAVITLEKRSNGKAVLQITGDEDIYGVETIIEPTREVYANAGYSTSRVVVNVWSWPVVRYIYGPHYSVWISPWGWRYRPHWWHAWRPLVYYDYYSYWRPYRHYYSVCHTHRIVYAHKIYRPYRTTSVIVHKRHNDRIVRYRSTRLDVNGRYRTDREQSNSRRISTSARYNSNGRIRSDSNQRGSSRTSVRDQGTRQNIGEYRNSARTSGNSNLTSRSSGTSVNRSETRKWESPNTSKGSRISTGRSNTNRYDKSTSAKQLPTRSLDKYSSNSRKSSPSSSVQRPSSRPSGSSNVQRSARSSKVQRSTSSSNVRKSTSSAGFNRSSRISNGGSSSRSSSIRRSSGNTSVQRSSGRTSGTTSSSRSKSSSKQSRGRH